MRRLWLVLLCLASLLVLPAATASALTCVPFDRQLPDLPVIVRGRVTAVTRLNLSKDTSMDPDYRVSLAATRYYKGQGVTAVDLLWDSSWDNPPPKVGWDVTLGPYRDRDGNLNVGPCSLRFYHHDMNPYMVAQWTRISGDLGAGVPPTDALLDPVITRPRGVWILWASFLLFGGLIVGFHSRKRK